MKQKNLHTLTESARPPTKIIGVQQINCEPGDYFSQLGGSAGLGYVQVF